MFFIAAESYSGLLMVFTATDNGSPSKFNLNENGWITLDQPMELLFWVPPWSVNGLWRPNNVMVIGRGSTKVDLRHFVHGTSWQQCREPLSMEKVNIKSP